MSSRRAVILGGTGGIGSAVARELLDASGRGGDDWQVDVLARRGGPAADSLTARGATFTAGDRRDTSTLRDLLRPGADLLVDTVGLTRDDATQLLPFLDDVWSYEADDVRDSATGAVVEVRYGHTTDGRIEAAFSCEISGTPEAPVVDRISPVDI